MAELTPRPAVFLDRDGVINEERDYVHRVADFVLLPGVVPALQRLQAAGWALVVVTNQGGIGKGLYTVKDMQILHAHMEALLLAHGVHLDAIYHCPHHPQGLGPLRNADCECRKPRPGMLLRAARDLNLDLIRSVLVGDKRSDIDAARAAGVGRAVLVRSGHVVPLADAMVANACLADLAEAARWIVDSNCSTDSSGTLCEVRR